MSDSPEEKHSIQEGEKATGESEIPQEGCSLDRRVRTGITQESPVSVTVKTFIDEHGKTCYIRPRDGAKVEVMPDYIPGKPNWKWRPLTEEPNYPSSATRSVRWSVELETRTTTK